MFSKLFPKEFNFYDFLDSEIAIAVSAAELFKELISKGQINDADREKMRDIEHEGDKMAYAIIDHLNKTFVTPFDREDIHTLAKKIDDINDMINTIVSRMKVYKIARTDATLIEFADMIVNSVKALACAIKGLREAKNSEVTLKSCVDVGKMESEGDKLRDKALGNLFENEKNPIELIKWKEFYQDAETVLDICKVVAHTVESIMVKRA